MSLVSLPHVHLTVCPYPMSARLWVHVRCFCAVYDGAVDAFQVWSTSDSSESATSSSVEAEAGTKEEQDGVGEEAEEVEDTEEVEEEETPRHSKCHLNCLSLL